MRRKLSLASLLLAWLFANGAVWNVVQVAAWTKMFHDYSRAMPATAALELTFDGSQPCELCRISQKARDAEREQLPPDAALGGGMDKIQLLADSSPIDIFPGTPADWPGAANATGLTRTDVVPVPPPRA